MLKRFELVVLLLIFGQWCSNMKLVINSIGMVGGIPSSALLAKGTGIADALNPSARTLQGLSYFDNSTGGDVDLVHVALEGDETVTSKSGTATVTPAVGKLTIGVGALFEKTLSNGSYYPGVCGILSATQGVLWDVSGNGRHLLFTVADTSTVCISGSREVGSNYLDEHGYTVADGTQYLSAVSFGLIPDDVVIPNLSSGGGCCAYEVA